MRTLFLLLALALLSGSEAMAKKEKTTRNPAFAGRGLWFACNIGSMKMESANFETREFKGPIIEQKRTSFSGSYFKKMSEVVDGYNFELDRVGNIYHAVIHKGALYVHSTFTEIPSELTLVNAEEKVFAVIKCELTL